jgi:hypothetical protein
MPIVGTCVYPVHRRRGVVVVVVRGAGIVEVTDGMAQVGMMVELETEAGQTGAVLRIVVLQNPRNYDSAEDILQTNVDPGIVAYYCYRCSRIAIDP